jgi:L-gulonate 5-dehydrogenase
MKAIYLKKPKDIVIKKVAYPHRKPNEVLIKVKAVGICGSDEGAYKGINPIVTYPRILGHEIVGELLEIPLEEEFFKVGDRVVVEPYIYCGHCYPCHIHRTNCCENMRTLGVLVDGGFTEFLAHHRKLIHKIPKSIPLEQAPMIEPLVIALHAINRSLLKDGEHLLVSGAGPIGILIAQAGRLKGAIPIMIDLVQERLDLARQLGIPHTFNLKEGDILPFIQEITNGRMAEVVIEASGASKAIRNAIDYISYAGRVVFVGWPKEEILMPTALFSKKELNIYGCRNGLSSDFDEAIEIIAKNKINVKDLITKVVSMDQLPEAIIQKSLHPDKFMKITSIF